MNLAEGNALVKLARKTVSDYFEKSKREIKPNGEKQGVFVSIHSFPQRELRGCIGFPLPIYPLREAVARAALSAALQDPRFPPLEKQELERVVFEVSVLSVPKETTAENVAVGRDGLIIEYRGFSGLLLPQVPAEFGWTANEFFDHLCLKAGLPTGAWKKKGVVLKSFQAEVFCEAKPNGDVENNLR